MKRRILINITAIIGMTILLLDNKTVLEGAREGIVLCIQTIIPALFPFLIISGIINSMFLGTSCKLIRPIGKLCKIPEGEEYILLLGLLGGYPVGAQVITQAYKAGSINKQTANRMLGFCNNAGPAFIFGILSAFFTKQSCLWALWIIHIFSAIMVGALIPGEYNSAKAFTKPKPITVQKSLQNAIKTIAVICGWVILYRIIILLGNKWLLWHFSDNIKVILSGALELSNGCLQLKNIPKEPERFLYATCFLSFGGMCVWMQTKGVIDDLDFTYYFPGKVLQTLISLLMALLIVPILFNVSNLKNYISAAIAVLMLISAIIYAIYSIYRKKLWQLRKTYSIISAKITRKDQSYAVSKEDNTLLQLLPTRRSYGR